MSWLSSFISNATQTVSSVAPTNPLNVNLGGLNFLRDQINPNKKKNNEGFSADQAREQDRASLIAEIDNAQLDDQTKQELRARAASLQNQSSPFNSGDTFTRELREELGRAISGQGKYASRLSNLKTLQIFADRPGAAQLFNSTASRVNAGNGLLTANPAGLLSRKV